jgi:2-aminoethylphosphonate-pyruvate transaminase
MTDKLLFTPGPLTTSDGVKQAMLRDLGSRDAEFIAVVREIRARLLRLAGADAGYEAVLMQGSGTFAVEATIGSVIPPQGRLLIAVNGAYGRRMAQIARRLAIEAIALEFPENEPVDPVRLANCLERYGPFTHVAVVHCETTTGLLNPLAPIGDATERAGAHLIVDAMSSFGGVPIDLAASHAAYLVSSANKCIQGVPGFGFVLARRDLLLATEGFARSVSLDLLAQWEGLEADGQFRFTPPTHALLAFRQALDELDQEGGVEGRAHRYAANHAALLEETQAIGLVPYLPRERQSSIIVTFRYPEDARFHFERFSAELSQRGFLIYPGKLTRENCFRIGCIGHIFPDDVRRLAAAMREVLAVNGVRMRRES